MDLEAFKILEAHAARLEQGTRLLRNRLANWKQTERALLARQLKELEERICDMRNALVAWWETEMRNRNTELARVCYQQYLLFRGRAEGIYNMLTGIISEGGEESQKQEEEVDGQSGTSTRGDGTGTGDVFVRPFRVS